MPLNWGQSSYKNQSIVLEGKSVNLFSYDGNIMLLNRWTFKLSLNKRKTLSPASEKITNWTGMTYIKINWGYLQFSAKYVRHLHCRICWSSLKSLFLIKENISCKLFTYWHCKIVTINVTWEHNILQGETGKVTRIL